MRDSRRRLLQTMLAITGTLAISPLLSINQAGGQTVRPLPSPNAPNPNVPSGMDGPQPIKEARVIPPVNAKEIRDSVEKMYDLVSDLKKQVESTDVNNTLSLTVVKKAQEIEKLAKHVKERAKG